MRDLPRAVIDLVVSFRPHRRYDSRRTHHRVEGLLPIAVRPESSDVGDEEPKADYDGRQLLVPR
jgi:hypothetical protein